MPKTVVMYLLDYLLETTRLEGIRLVLAKPAGPELAPNQVGEEELMPFPRARRLLRPLRRREDVARRGARRRSARCSPSSRPRRSRRTSTKFVRLFPQSIYKWVQAPLSLHVGNLDLDRERALQLPVVTEAEWALKKKK